MSSGTILFIDAYDSFSNSIAALLKSELHVSIVTIKIDDPRFVLNDEAFFHYLDGFDAVVAGPGPGHPANPGDVGLIGRLWTLPEEHIIPVLGICLGFQSLCHASGGHVVRLREPRHGIMAMVYHNGKDIFKDAGKIVATQYHSLHVKFEEDTLSQEELDYDFHPFETRGDLQPLAWDLMNVSIGPVLMAVKHLRKPFWGVQYHPESICTNAAGQRLVSNWWQSVRQWGNEHGRRTSPALGTSDAHQCVAIPRVPVHSDATKATNGRRVRYENVNLPADFDMMQLMDLFRVDNVDLQPLLLESGTRNGSPVNPETGRFSILGLRDSSCQQLRYCTSTHRLRGERHGELVFEQPSSAQDVFQHVDRLMCSLKASNGPSQSPFWGGLIGYISYEAGLETIDVTPPMSTNAKPDMWFVLVERSIVVDHVERVAYVQTIREADNDWLLSAREKLKHLRRDRPEASVYDKSISLDGRIISEPQKQEYRAKFDACQSNLRAGESYELCLTDQTVATTPMDSWALYCHLRNRNPAPFSSFLRFSSASQPGISIVSSSPERFLSWDRGGRSQFRPIKGTVKKTAEMTRAKAESILGSAKERAENLMIVDLIRHDLAGVIGVDQVRVPKLMSIEEYETVFQLVSVIEGVFDSSISPTAALAASLPPGSMTGAPKKRSCELLRSIEGEQPRGLYSGVIGFFDAGGGGDFSVVIRTAFKWDEDGDGWRVGAGGAITVLSESDAEWEEMLTKRESVLKSFL